MTVWCGQCQAKNDESARRCVECGAPLMPSIPGAPTSTVRVQEGSGENLRSVVSHFDPSWIVQGIGEIHPGAVALQEMVARCRVALREETGSGGTGFRTYFLPERSDYAILPDHHTYVICGQVVTIVLASSTADASRKAVYSIECKPAPSTAPLAAQLAQYENLWRACRQLARAVWLVPVVTAAIDIAVTAFILVAFSTLNSSLSFAYVVVSFLASALTVAMAFEARNVGVLLADRRGAIDRLEKALELNRLGASGRFAARRRGGESRYIDGSTVAPSLLLTLSIVMLWLTVRVLTLSGPSLAWETALVLIGAAILYPLVILLSRWRKRRALDRAVSEFIRSSKSSAECPFEPWSRPASR